MSDIITLAGKINLSEETVAQLEALLNKKRDNVIAFTERCMGGNFSCLKRKNGIFRLAVILNVALEVRSRYDEAGIDEKIYYDTMSDIKIWCDKTGGKGIKNYGWLKNHLKFELFRLGRLQFQLYECKNRTLIYNKLPFSYGEKLIYVHIPEGEPLDNLKCREAFGAAIDFFGKYFPDYDFRYFFCESWLLYEGNREFMKPDSNIVRFMDFFDCRYSVKIDAQAIERIYGKRCLLKKSYPENTSLQKRAKAYMLSGGKLGIGIGVKEK